MIPLLVAAELVLAPLAPPVERHPQPQEVAGLRLP
jgi:hypothetical protein